MLVAQPVLDASKAASLLDISRVTGRNALQSLTDRGILEPVAAPSPGLGDC